MAKSNDKKKRTSGVLNSANILFPHPMRTQNSPTDAETGFSDKARIHRNSKTNQQY